MSNYSKNIVYLSQQQYKDLITNQSITVDGVTIEYNENDIYVTPQSEPVTDVIVNGNSVNNNGIANILAASSSVAGVVKVVAKNGVQMNASGEIYITRANPTHIKNNSGVTTSTLSPADVKGTAFYGLSNAAGDTTQHAMTYGDFTYTPEAKGAIQQMLGVSDLIGPAENNLVASKAYKVGDVFTANGKLYKATAAIAADAAIITDGANANCVETSVGEGFVKFTDYATSSTPGVMIVRPYDGHQVLQGRLIHKPAASHTIKNGTDANDPIVSSNQHESAFYGLAKAAGDTTQSASDNAVGTYTDDAKSAIRTMLGAVGTEDYATSDTAGIIKASDADCLTVSNGLLKVKKSALASIKACSGTGATLVPSQVNSIAFYGLAHASGDTTQSSSSNAVGTYTDNAKASIKAMLGIQDGSTGTVDVTGTTPTITAVENTRYVCGEVTSLNFTPPASGISIVRFTSGSSVTVLTIPSTVKFPEWFDPTSLETNTIYEICVTDGEFGAVMSWAL